MYPHPRLHNLADPAIVDLHQRHATRRLHHDARHALDAAEHYAPDHREAILRCARAELSQSNPDGLSLEELEAEARAAAEARDHALERWQARLDAQLERRAEAEAAYAELVAAAEQHGAEPPAPPPELAAAIEGVRYAMAHEPQPEAAEHAYADAVIVARIDAALGSSSPS